MLELSDSFIFFSHDNAVEQTLTSMITSGRLSHAVLLYGERGLGKKTLCRRLAMQLLCVGQGTRPCLSCEPCRKILHGSHPDVIWVEHSGKRQGFSVEAIRSLCADAYIRPNDGECKVYILADCDSISASAQNTLLKLLEEPPANVTFLLTAESRVVFLPTILSRVAAFPLSPVSDEQCRKALSLHGITDPERQEEAISAFGGNIGKCLDAISNPDTMQTVSAARELAAALAQRNEYALLKVLRPLEGARPLAMTALGMTAEIVRDAYAAKLNPSLPLRSVDKEQAKRLSGVLTLRQALRAIEVLEDGISAIDANANMSLLLSATAAKLMGE